MGQIYTFANRSSNKLRLLTLHQEVTFVSKQNLFPLLYRHLLVSSCSLKALFFIFLFNNCFFIGRLAILPRRFRIRLTVRVLTFNPTSCSNSPLVFFGNFLLVITNFLSSLSVVFAFLPHFPFRIVSICPCVLAWLMILTTVDWFLPTILAISRVDFDVWSLQSKFCCVFLLMCPCVLEKISYWMND